jgi:hypothetical protein
MSIQKLLVQLAGTQLAGCVNATGQARHVLITTALALLFATGCKNKGKDLWAEVRMTNPQERTDVDALFRFAQGDHDGATRLYGDKIVRVKGRVDGVSEAPNELGSVRLNLGALDSEDEALFAKRVQCFLDAKDVTHVASAKALARGRVVAVVGKGFGFDGGAEYLLGGCFVQNFDAIR